MDGVKESSIFELVIDQEGSDYLKETAKWAKFLSILGLIVGIIMVLAGVVLTFMGGSLGEAMNIPGFGALIGILYLGLGLIYLYPCWKMLQFAGTMPVGLQKSDQTLVNEALRNLKTSFRFWGILSLVIIGLYLLVFVGSMIFAAFGT